MIEQRAFEKFTETLESMRCFDSLRQELLATDAVSLVRQQLAEAVFQLPSDSSNIHILGLLEATGLQFDDLIVVGLTEQRFPAQANPNPYLPLWFQRQHNLANATADQMMTFAQSQLAHLKLSAPTVRFVHFVQDSDQEYRASALLSDLPVGSLNIPIDEPVQELQPITLVDAQQLPSDYIQFPEVRGGSGFFKAMIECPMRGFLQYQLDLSSADQDQLGVDYRHRGIWLHSVMEKFYRSYPSSKMIRRLSDKDISELLSNLIGQEVSNYITKEKLTIEPLSVEIEQQRLHGMLTALIEIDRRRPDFSVDIERLEARQTVQVAGLSLTVATDRVDIINGKKFYVDYKTGDVKLNQVNPERLSEPQLPLYAMLDLEQSGVSGVEGVAFAEVHDSKIGYIGLASSQAIDNDCTTPETKVKGREWYVDMKNTIDQWQQTFQLLVDEYLTGSVSLQKKTSACNYCEYGAICRINEVVDNQAGVSYD
jgi:probable DNA repair protein